MRGGAAVRRDLQGRRPFGYPQGRWGRCLDVRVYDVHVLFEKVIGQRLSGMLLEQLPVDFVKALL